MVGGVTNELSSDASSPEQGIDDGVDQEGMNTPVPCHVDPADKLVDFSRTDPPQAVLLALPVPVPFVRGFSPEALSMQPLDFVRLERSAP